MSPSAGMLKSARFGRVSIENRADFSIETEGDILKCCGTVPRPEPSTTPQRAGRLAALTTTLQFTEDSRHYHGQNTTRVMAEYSLSF